MQLEAEQTERRKFQAIAEPPKSKFMQSGHYTADVDLTALNVIADVGVSPSVVPMLFVIFARFFGVKIPSRSVTVPGPTSEDGKRTSVKRDLLFIPSKTHCKQLPAIGGELHNIQVSPMPWPPSLILSLPFPSLPFPSLLMLSFSSPAQPVPSRLALGCWRIPTRTIATLLTVRILSSKRS